MKSGFKHCVGRWLPFLLLFVLLTVSAVFPVLGAESMTTYVTALPNKTQEHFTSVNGGGTCRITKTAGGDALLTSSFSPVGATVTVEMTLRADGDRAIAPFDLRLRHNSSNSVSFFELASNGKMTLKAGGKSYALGTLAGEAVDLAFTVTFNSGNSAAYRIDAYVNGVLYWENISFTTSGTVVWTSPISYYLYFGKTTAGSVCIDRFQIHSASEPVLTPMTGAAAHLLSGANDVPDRDIHYSYGVTTALPAAAEMTRTGYTFGGWYTNADFTGSSVTAIPSSARGVQSYYAKWIPRQYTVTWNVNGTLTAEQYDFGTVPVYTGSTTKPATSEYSYTFNGWYDGKIKAFSLPAVSGDVTYTASYVTEPGYTVIYHRTYEGANPTAGLNIVTKDTAVIAPVTKNGNTYISHTVNSTVTDDSYFEKGFSTLARYLTISFDVSSDGSVLSSGLQYKSVSGSVTSAISFLNISASGDVTCAGTVIGRVSAGTWLHLDLILDLENHLITAYSNDTERVSAQPYASNDCLGAKLLRFYVSSSASNANRNLLVDNLAVYTGNVLRELPDNEPTDPAADRPTKEVFNGSVAMKLGTDAMLAGGVNGLRSEIPAPVSYTGITYLPVAALAEAFGYAVSGTAPLTLTLGARTLTVGNGATVTDSGSPIALDHPAITYDGTLMLSVSDAARVFGKYLYADSMGLIILSDHAAIADLSCSEDLSILITLMEAFVFDNPTGEQIIAALTPEHPRLIATAEQFSAARTAYLASEASDVKTWVTSLIASANSSLNRADPVYGYDVGDRMGTGSNNYLFSWGFAYQMTGDTKYADRSLRWIWALSQFDDWDPGHSLNSAETAQGVAVAYDWMYDAWSNTAYWTTAKVTELIGADAAARLTVNPDGTRDVIGFIEDTLYYYGIAAAIGSYNGTTEQVNKHGTGGRSGWVKTTNNWNCVCNAGYLMSCLALAGVDTPLSQNIIPTSVSTVFSSKTTVNTPGSAKPSLLSSTAYSTETAGGMTTYTEEIAWLMTKIMESLKIGIRCYAPDGSYEESSGYWSYGTGNFFLLCESLFASTGTTYGLMEAAGIDRTVYFAVHIESSDNYSWGYHDSSPSNMPTVHAFFAGSYFGDANLSAIRYNSVLGGNKGASIYDALFYDAELAKSSATLPLDYLMEGIETATMRTSWDRGAIFTGLHGGYNSVNHGDIDAGNFIYDANGLHWFVDLGADEYNLPGYFGVGENGARWKYFKKNAEAQNTICIVNDRKLPYGQNPIADIPVVRYESDLSRVIAVLDMTDAYGSNAIDGKRAMMLLRESGAVVIQDEISFSAETCLYWLAQTGYNITVSEDGHTAYLTVQSGGATHTLRASLLSEDASLSFTVIGNDVTLLSGTAINVAGEKDRSGYQRLAVYAHNVTAFNCAVVLEMVDDPASAVDYTLTGIDNWTLSPDSTVTFVNGNVSEPVSVPYGESVTVPGGAALWIGSDGAIYRAGDLVTPSGSMTLTAVTVELLDGASIRANESNSGLRFESRIPESVLSAALAAGIPLRAGSLIVASDLLSGTFTAAALTAAGIPYLDLSGNAAGFADGRFYASIINLFPENYTRSFSAVSYLTFTVAEETYTVYSAYDPALNSRSVYQVASILYATDSARYTAEELAIVRSFIDGVVELEYDPATNSFRSFHSVIDRLPAASVTLPYQTREALLDAVSGDLVIPGGASVGTVILNGVTYTRGWTVDGEGNLRVANIRSICVQDDDLYRNDFFGDGFGADFPH